MIGFRCPDDLAEGFEQYCGEAGKTSGEVLRKLVDDLLYPGSGRERLKARQGVATLADLERLYGVNATQWVADQVNAQIKEQLGHLVDEKLELVQIDRGLTEAEKRHYDASLASLERNLAKLKVSVDSLETSECLRSAAYQASLNRGMKE